MWPTGAVPYIVLAFTLMWSTGAVSYIVLAFT